MRKLLTAIVFFTYLTGCGIEDRIDSALEQCQAIVDEQVEKVWEDCTSYYEKETENLIQKILDEFDKRLGEYENEIMLRLGCTPDSTNSSGWDCSGSQICQ